MNTRKTLLDMLTYRRPAWSKTESTFIRKYIDTIPGIICDGFGNRLLLRPDSRIMIACHTDTVHRFEGKQRVQVKGAIAQLPKCSVSNCLGADDTAGIYAALCLIDAGCPATFVFHRAEEIGGRGSQWLADNYPKWVESHDICLSLDRRGTADIITSQWGGETASHAFAWSLAAALDMGHSPAEGIFTDSANYADLIPECSNLSIGYRNEHTARETLDLVYLEAVIQRLITVDWSALTVARDPSTLDSWDDLDDEWVAWLNDNEYTDENGTLYTMTGRRKAKGAF